MLFDPSDLPGIVRELYNKGAKTTGDWMPAVKEAVKQNIRDTNKLTDLVFYIKNPEMLGQKIQSHQKLLIAEWKFYNALVKVVMRDFGRRFDTPNEPPSHQYSHSGGNPETSWEVEEGW